MIKRAIDAGLVSIPGAFSPTEIETAWRAGAELVKVFPAGDLGPSYIKSLRGPMGDIPLVPTGGISAENASAFIDAGAVALGVGGGIVDKEAIAAGDWDKQREKVREFLSAIG